MTLAIALAALLVSFSSLGIQFLTWWRARHRVAVTARSSTVGGGPGGGNINFTYATLAVRNVGRAISIEDVTFRAVDEAPTEQQHASWGNPPTLATAFIPFEPLPNRATGGVLIPDGGSKHWIFSLYPPPSMRSGRWEPVQFVAEVELSSGKMITSDPFWHSQSPADGWDVTAE